MPRERSADRAARTVRIIAALQKVYPAAHCELEHRAPLELLIATVLSAQCTDKQVNVVTQGLFKKYRTAVDYVAASPSELEADIRSIGFFRVKARNIRALCQALIAKHGGEVPRTMEELTALNGVGRKTANVVLGNAFGIQSGVVVDTHVARLSGRMGLSTEKTPEKIELDLMELVPSERWTIFSHWLIWHGRRRCSARSPDCEHCEIKDLCPRKGVR